MYLRATSAFLTSLVNGISGGTLKDVALLNANPGETANAGGLRLVATQPPPDRSPAAVPGSSATVAGYINTGAQTITPPANYGPVWLEIPVSWLRALFAGTGITPPNNGPLQLCTECALDARGGWENWLVQSGLFAAFSNPTALPIPSVSA